MCSAGKANKLLLDQSVPEEVTGLRTLGSFVRARQFITQKGEGSRKPLPGKSEATTRELASHCEGNRKPLRGKSQASARELASHCESQATAREIASLCEGTRKPLRV
ncbi:hypothetical protein EJ06DRAFT_530970, partial [Trichodelitschia bisporula]